MARFYDKVGYGVSTEVVNGVWSDTITERSYYGDVLNQTSTNVESDKVNEDISLSQRVSIVADTFALGNYSNIKYVIQDGIRWEVNSIEVKRPRLILSLGGPYNGPTPT